MSMTRQEFEARIVAKASADEAFRKALLADPKATLQAELQEIKSGVTLPADLKVSVVEETHSHIYLRLPIQAAGELTEEQLMSVSGGAGSQPVAVAVVTVGPGPVSIDVTAVVAPAVTVVVAPGPNIIVL